MLTLLWILQKTKRTVIHSAETIRLKAAVFVTGSFLGYLCMATPSICAAQEVKNAVQTPTAIGNRPILQQRPNLLQIHRGDLLEITFPYVPEFNQTNAVQADGKLVLRSVGAVQAEGLTLEQLAEEVKTAYSSLLLNPVLTITPKEMEKPFFTAAGIVAKPGRYPLGDETNITEAVAIAGGFTDASKRTQVIVFHRVNGAMFETHVYDVKKLYKQMNLGEDPWLHPGDIVYVPQNRLSKVMRFVPNQSIGAYVTPF
jgi:protein involved in polysaccharide export with SLBB domain